ncbi:MAG: bifunctional diaminohydroxyphosphoribosylaminopyrimidine deaminase/5-amino-6-(5-phosphoribosylamino)uracil reductase RibD [Alphaproteobacteria bacterium]
MHEFYMKKAIELALKGEGHTAPNPNVGCVIVKDGQIIAQGYHQQYGGLHAEKEALKNIPLHKTQGATAYVTLEPCCHHGKQPPCVDALIEAQITHVVFPFCDMNKKVYGQSLQKLCDAGIGVTLGVCVEECFDIITDFATHQLTSRPYVRAKWAMSADGKIATHNHDSRWISNAKSRNIAHQLRHQSQAILVGANTLRHDNPKLNTRFDIQTPSHPIPIILLGKNPIDTTAQIFQNPKTMIIAPSDYAHLLPKNTQHITLDTDHTGYISPTHLLNTLGEHKITSLLIEGGGQLLSSFMEQDLIDEYHIFIAPKLIGGKDAPTAFDGQGFATMEQSLRLIYQSSQLIDEDIYLQYISQKFHQWKKEQISCLQVS